MENEKQLGGKRKGAGRKPVLSKKKQISLYVEGSKILKFGNEEKMKTHLYGVIDAFGNEPELNNQVSYAAISHESFEGNRMSKVVRDEQGQWEEPKSSTTGLSPKLSPFADFMAELGNATTISQVEAIMNRAKGEVFTPRDKMTLEAKAKEVSKEMFND